MKRRLLEIGLPVIGLFLCALGGSILPPLWQVTSGRDFRPQAFNMGILLFIMLALFRGRLKWHWVNLVAALAIIEVFTLLTISHFNEYSLLEIFSSDNLEWLAFMNKYIGLPWLLGLGVGSLWLLKRGHRSQ